MYRHNQNLRYNWRRNKSLNRFGAFSFIVQITTPEENQAFFLDLLFSLCYVTFLNVQDILLGLNTNTFK
jgi:hypothetical protein